MRIRVARAVSGIGERARWVRARHTTGEAHNTRTCQKGRQTAPITVSGLAMSTGLPDRPRTYDADDASRAVEVELAVRPSVAAPIEILAHGAGR
jgi:hypothetical protein